MKKLTVIFLIVFAFSVKLSAQTEIPEVSIRDINYVEPDSLLYYGAMGTEPRPPLAGVNPAYGPTVWITGVVMNSPYLTVNDPTSTAALAAGAPAFFIQDTAAKEWSGVLLRNPKNYSPEVFHLLDTGMVVRVKVGVTEYYTTTEADLVEFGDSNIIGYMQRPKPVVLTLDSFFVSPGQPNFLAEKWEGVYVELQNLTTTEPGAVGSGSFKVFDDKGLTMVVYNKSYRIRNGFQAPLAGTKIKSLRGYIETRTGGNYGWFMIDPVYLEDIVYGDKVPANITEIKRDIVNPQFGQDVKITAKIVDPDGTVSSGNVMYSVNGQPTNRVAMTKDTGSDYWSGVIPGVNDSSHIAFYITAKDDQGNPSFAPNDTVNGKYFYYVLNRDLKISDVQKSPLGSGYSAYNGYEVSVTGVVVADTSDIIGDGANTGTQIIIQDGTGPWSAIQIFGTEADPLKKGDLVTATGIVNESNNVTRIGNLTQGAKVTINQSGVALPEPTLISTSEIDGLSSGKLPAESYESVLVKFQNLTVTDDNADGLSGPDQGTGGSRNFGEILVADNSNVNMRVELQDGTHSYHNMWDGLLEGKGTQVSVGDKFDELIGIMFFSFSNYKLIPRTNDDFIGYSTDVEEMTIPKEFSLSQNYPNPFNPSTKIKFSLPKSGFVKLSVYNILGQEVANLVNENKSAGTYTVDFNAHSLSSGIYFYSIKTDYSNSIKKMLLIK
jgi:hypothetical protein